MVDTSRSCRSAPNHVIPFIKAWDEDVAEVDRPDAILNLIETHVLALERGGQEEQPSPEAEGAAAGDPLHEIVPRVLDRRQVPWIRSG